ncbi:MAG: transposase [Candidatus Desulfofervidaceae bacterium]|nr:transposase [Candidatus Desulfofervidaceae bacterium]MDL1969962.1 zinc ribbon domain-containing protein [Candidatus Desulfofervidaceae bacterium]
MKLSYKLKVYANKGKIGVLETLARFWQKKVNYYINFYWKAPDWELKLNKPPKEFRGSGSKLENLASVKAWQTVKSIRNKKRGQKDKPVFRKDEFELDETLFTFENFTTKEFDFWIKSYSGKRGGRIAIPFKKHRRLNYWLNKGARLQKTVKFKKVNNNWYAIVYLQPKKVKTKQNVPVVGIDIDYTNGAVDSAGNIWFDKEWVALRKRTKWREYKNGNNPLKQAFNRLAKTLVNTYRCHFALEKLNFKGKKGRSKKFRRDYKNLPYGYLARRLETLAHLEGFQVVRVNPAGTSQTCPVCGFKSRENRNGDYFKCKDCGFKNQADVVGATNIALRASLRYRFQPVVAQAVAEEWGRQGIQPPLEYFAVCTPPQSRPPADFRRCDPLCHTYLTTCG